jgi:hypothetical protein
VDTAISSLVSAAADVLGQRIFFDAKPVLATAGVRRKLGFYPEHSRKMYPYIMAEI